LTASSALTRLHVSGARKSPGNPMAGREGSSELGAQTVRELLLRAVDELRAAGVDTPVLDAEVMLSRTLGRSRTELLAHPEAVPPQEVVERFSGWVSRRSRREPLAYIIGEREFYGICFEVSPAVLIPRPETEILVETAIGLIKGVPAPRIADIGLGSGAVAVSIAKAAPDAVIYGTESSVEALEIARRNAQRADVQNRTHFLQGDLLEPLAGMTFRLIVSNPPYIPGSEIEGLQPEIAKYEPRQALDGGPDGLDYHRRLAGSASACLEDKGVLAVEVGAGQADAVERLFRAAGLRGVRSVRDYSGIERVVLGER